MWHTGVDMVEILLVR